MPLFPFFFYLFVLITYLGKGAKISTVNLKMGNYNSDKFKGAKSYTVNQNGVKPYIITKTGPK